MSAKRESPQAARVALLVEEIHAIHWANRAYWEQGNSQQLKARAAYHRRIERLQEIRSELATLPAPAFSPEYQNGDRVEPKLKFFNNTDTNLMCYIRPNSLLLVRIVNC
jgi:hypothetical protein